MTSDELIAALEAATGPSRELDAAILTSVGHQTLNRKKFGWEWRRNGVGMWSYMPAPTSSLDAALTLVPESFGVELRTYPLAPTGHKHTPMARVLANQSRRDPLRWDEAGIGDAPTPALALCIAALRARSAQP